MKTNLYRLIIFFQIIYLGEIVEAQHVSSGSDSPLNHESFCATDYLHRKRLREDSAYSRKHRHTEESIHKRVVSKINRANQNYRLSPATYTIPVVVHIIHNGGTENISDAQVIAGIQHLNDAFEHVSPFDGVNGEDTKIEFCLAKQDPDGNFTTGINRVVSTLTNHDLSSSELALKNLNRWDPTEFVNIWLVKEICAGSDCGTAGYAYLSSSHGSPYDGIVCEAGLFGSSKTTSKVHVHEMGHYLDLYHTFQDGCANGDCLIYGDRVCDTPPDNSQNSSLLCGMTENSCTTDSDDPGVQNPYRAVALGGAGDQSDMLTNYMDYANLSCENEFTPGQITRMHAAIEGPRSSLLSSKGCFTTCTSPIVSSFTVPSTTINAGTLVNFTNTSTGATNYTWKLNGTTFSSVANPGYTFNTVGTFTITLVASNAQPGCTEEYNKEIQVVCSSDAAFTSDAFIAEIGETVNFTNATTANSFTWKVNDVAFASTQNASYSFTSSGNYLITLIVSNAICSDTAYKVIRVENPNRCSINSKFANTWFFGKKAGVVFTSGSPVALAGSKVDTDEGVATISDENGDLLFYTDGITVWDKTHTVMPNGTGLLGHRSSTQSGVIVPMPGSKTKFYIFTVDDLNSYHDQQVTYSIVDLTLNGGLGDVIAASKNTFVHKTASEKITATMHANGCDIWVITYDLRLGNFHSHLITSSGISLNTKISSGGMNYSSNWDNTIGYLRASPNGQYLAMALLDVGVDLFDFNASTGTVSNNRRIYTRKAGFAYYSMGAYGVEFSPDNSRLYFTSWDGGSYIHQVDLTAGSTAAIVASRVSIATHATSSRYSAMQTGPDGKIYVVVTSASALGAIPYPTLAGASAGFIENAVALPAGSQSVFGLPNFIASNFHSIDFDYSCGSNVTTFTPYTSIASPEGYTWHFGEPSSGSADTSYLANPTHTYAIEGSYRVTLTIDKGCMCRSFTKDITVPSLCALPVELSGFKISLQSVNEVLLQWSTASEHGSGYFEVERSYDGYNFEFIGKRNAARFSNTIVNYSFSDHNFSRMNSQLYYRLKIVDLNGSVEYSSIESVTMPDVKNVSIFPNPTSASVTVLLESEPGEGIEFALTDLAGKELRRWECLEKGKKMHLLPLENLSNGTYLLKIVEKGGNLVVSYKVMKE